MVLLADLGVDIQPHFLIFQTSCIKLGMYLDILHYCFHNRTVPFDDFNFDRHTFFFSIFRLQPWKRFYLSSYIHQISYIGDNFYISGSILLVIGLARDCVSVSMVWKFDSFFLSWSH